jgi:hypothetical protein
MANFKISEDSWLDVQHEGKPIRILKKAVIDGFKPSILGLGDISMPSKSVATVAAVFDLARFTQFCGQLDPNLSVPAYLTKFLSWLMNQLKKETIQTEYPEGSTVWHPLPFFTKFMGDGLLVLWAANSLNTTSRNNLIISLKSICQNYELHLLPQLKSIIVAPPPSLRCGVARGTVYSVGDGADYIGGCINMAARIQKLPGITFAFNRRGFDLEENPNVAKEFVVRKVAIRGINDAELLAVLRSDLETMDADVAGIYELP